MGNTAQDEGESPEFDMPSHVVVIVVRKKMIHFRHLLVIASLPGINIFYVVD